MSVARPPTAEFRGQSTKLLILFLFPISPIAFRLHKRIADPPQKLVDILMRILLQSIKSAEFFHDFGQSRILAELLAFENSEAILLLISPQGFVDVVAHSEWASWLCQLRNFVAKE
jgi:hypothetical protein